MQPAIRDKAHSTKVGLAMGHMICSPNGWRNQNGIYSVGQYKYSILTVNWVQESNNRDYGSPYDAMGNNYAHSSNLVASQYELNFYVS